MSEIDLETKIHYRLFDFQDEFLEFVEDNYKKWKMSQKHKDKLSQAFWEFHKLNCAMMVIDNVENRK